MKKPTKAQLSNAGKVLRNPHSREANETKAAKTLAAGRKKISTPNGYIVAAKIGFGNFPRI